MINSPNHNLIFLGWCDDNSYHIVSSEADLEKFECYKANKTNGVWELIEKYDNYAEAQKKCDEMVKEGKAAQVSRTWQNSSTYSDSFDKTSQ